jgi:hypothetical protein
MLVLVSHPEWGAWAEFLFSGWAHVFTQIAIHVAVFLTFISGGLYLWRNRQIYLDDI